MDLGINGRVALIAGADSGIGFSVAQHLLAEGVQLVISDLDQGKLDEAVQKLSAESGRKVVGIAADLTDSAAVRRLRERVLNEVGTPQILVNTAGVTGATGLFHEVDEEGWRKTLEIDFLGVVRLVRAFIDDMRGSGWGRIVLTASEDAVQPYIDELPYCAAKAAILSLTKGLSKSYAKEGILVNAVSPAYIQTPMTDAMMEKRAEKNGTSVDEAIKSFLKEERPFIELNRRGKPEEVAAVIAFLCSEKASFVNGSNYRVDAGSVATI
jgi:NAD(P)-dependent dehydrogenase (short-subunit alcohol dehydrogenase family)